MNMFLPKDKVVLTMKGKLQRANNEYKTTVEPIDTLMPIVVLVSGNTASAAEILSGSLQDYDRAIILGTRTYGKGLVQATMDLPYNGQMKLTTSKYYIPSGDACRLSTTSMPRVDMWSMCPIGLPRCSIQQEDVRYVMVAA